MSSIVCKPKSLTAVQQATARRRVIELHPAAIQQFEPMVEAADGRRGSVPRRLALIIKRR